MVTLAISSNNSFIVTGSKDKTAKIWNAVTGDCLNTLISAYPNGIISVAISPDNSFIVTCSKGVMRNRVEIWDSKTGNCLNTFIDPNPDSDRVIRGRSFVDRFMNFPVDPEWITLVEISPDNSFIVTVATSGMLRIWNIKQAESLT